MRTTASRTLDEWYLTVNKIYLDRNYYRDRFSIFAHLVEILGGLSLLASGKEKPGVVPEAYVPKALAWWMALCGKVGVRSVERLLWQKFPGVCTYCHRSPHDDDICRERKAASRGPDWAHLTSLGRQNAPPTPPTLAKWQQHFAAIYPVTSTEAYPATIGRFTEELGELAEALRVFPVAPGYFLSEAADVFAWLMHLQNLLHSRLGFKASGRGEALSHWFESAYPGACRDCSNPVCTCPPILPGTLGRIAHEIPSTGDFFAADGALLRSDEAIHLFDLGARNVALGSSQFAITVDLIRDVHKVVTDLKAFAITNQHVAEAHSLELSRAITRIEQLSAAQRLTQESIDALAQAIAAMPSESRTALVNFLGGLASNAWALALVEAVGLLLQSPR